MVYPQIRRKARECVLQLLFSWEFADGEPEGVLEAFWKLTPAKQSVRDYAEKIVHVFTVNRHDIDKDIEAALDNWSPERVGCVERAALRMAYTEMKYLSDVPPTVAINEAIEVTKRFGSDDSPRFVNGVLDRLRKNVETPHGDVTH